MSRLGRTLKAAAVVVSLRALTALLQRWFCLVFCGLFRLLLFSYADGTSVFEMKAPRHHSSISMTHGLKRYSSVQQPLFWNNFNSRRTKRNMSFHPETKGIQTSAHKCDENH